MMRMCLVSPCERNAVLNKSPCAVRVGNPVEGWNPAYETLQPLEERVDVAARLATYENAIFTITATLGLIGLLLWARVLYWLYQPFAFKILRQGIRHSDDALAFVAVQTLIVYLTFSWIAGGYPSTLCVLGVLAAASFFERRHAGQRPVPNSTLRRAHPPHADKSAAS